MLVSGVAAGLLAGLLVGREWRRIANLHVVWLPLLVIALAARAAAPLLPGFAFALYILALGATTVVAAANWRLAGAWLVGLGSALNLLVVVSNTGMPVDPSALAAADAPPLQDALHVGLDESTRLPSLGDKIPIALFHAVYSAGDFAIALGGFFLSFVTLVRR